MRGELGPLDAPTGQRGVREASGDGWVLAQGPVRDTVRGAPGATPRTVRAAWKIP